MVFNQILKKNTNSFSWTVFQEDLSKVWNSRVIKMTHFTTGKLKTRKEPSEVKIQMTDAKNYLEHI